MNSNEYQVNSEGGLITPKTLREVLDLWCKVQPEVIRFVDSSEFEPGWEARVWSPKCDMSEVGFHWESVAVLGGLITPKTATDSQ